MELQQVNPVRLKPAQGLINLLCRSVFGAAVALGHQEHLLPVAVPQRFAHPAFARAVVIVPAVVHKVDPVVDGGANDADTLLLVGLLAEVIAAQAHNEWPTPATKAVAIATSKNSRRVTTASCPPSRGFRPGRPSTLAAVTACPSLGSCPRIKAPFPRSTCGARYLQRLARTYNLLSSLGCTFRCYPTSSHR